MMNWDQDFPISELRIVQLRYSSGSSDYERALMHVSQVQDFIKAKLELHYEPGVNPHVYQAYLVKGLTPEQAKEKSRTSGMWEIHVMRIVASEAMAFWHTSPGLKDDSGAKTLREYMRNERVWAHPDLLEDERRAQEQEDNED